MKISVVTLFPEFFSSPLDVSIVARAIEGGALAVSTCASTGSAVIARWTMRRSAAGRGW